MLEPSGENLGSVSTPTPEVRRLASPPERLTLQRSPANENTICVLLKAGFWNRYGRRPLPAAGLAGMSKTYYDSCFPFGNRELFGIGASGLHNLGDPGDDLGMLRRD